MHFKYCFIKIKYEHSALWNGYYTHMQLELVLGM